MAEYQYDVYGNIVNEATLSDIGKKNKIRYKGYYYDEETSLFWLFSRYYSPELCRFISPDDTEYLDLESVNGLNLYCYCYNDPINYYDPSGHFVIIATIGLSATAYYAIIALLAVTAVATTAYVESETHIIQNSLTSLGNTIVDIGESIPRINSNSKKKAREKAFLKGGKRPPIHHPNGKHGPHYYPNDPKFSQWHYYYY